MFMRREEKEDPYSYYFWSLNLMTSWRGGVEKGKKEKGLVLD
jgi:hypothetical protein